MIVEICRIVQSAFDDLLKYISITSSFVNHSYKFRIQNSKLLLFLKFLYQNDTLVLINTFVKSPSSQKITLLLSQSM